MFTKDTILVLTCFLIYTEIFFKLPKINQKYRNAL